MPASAVTPAVLDRRLPASEVVELPMARAKACDQHSADAVWASGSSDASPSVTPAAASTLRIHLRWHVQQSDLRRLHQMHEDAFPLGYSLPYYEWLLSSDACIPLIALTTPAMYKAWTRRNRTRKGDAFSLPTTTATTTSAKLREEGSASCTTPLPPQEVLLQPPASPASATPPCDAGGAPPPPPPSLPSSASPPLPRKVPPPVSKRTFVAPYLREERAEILSFIAAQELNQVCSSGGPASHPEDDETYTVIVGFIFGQLAYARHDDGFLLSNPTAYIGSFVVDPPLQGCGLGHALLDRFLHYVLQRRPVYAQDCLHYDERQLVALLAEAKLRSRTTIALAAATASLPEVTVLDATKEEANHNTNERQDWLTTGPSAVSTPISPSPASGAGAATVVSGVPTFLKNLISAYLPELHSWMEDRQARQRLRKLGLTEDEVDVHCQRERLIPDVLTDEEAEAVRREARQFELQTGVRDVWLHCIVGNDAALRFYARHGFKQHRTLVGYYDIDDVPYDAHLLLYAVPSGSSARDSGSQGPSEVAAADAPSSEKQDEGGRIGRCSPTVVSVPQLVPAFASTGLRRRRDGPLRTDRCDAEGADHDLSETEGPTETHAQSSLRGDKLKVLASPPSSTSSSPARWLSPQVYPHVANVFIGSTEEGRVMWRWHANAEANNDTGERWSTLTRELLFVFNAFGLLCAVLWLAYNVGLTGKVE